LLDITRLISRAGRMPTGVDRVELAYLQNLSTCPEPLFAIARTTLGYVLLDAGGIAAIRSRIEGGHPWGMADWLARLARKKPVPVRQAESDLRRFALDRCRPRNLTKMLARQLPRGIAYLNTGHSNLTDRMLRAVRRGVDGRVAVLIHDVIPLDFPHYQRPGTPERFRAQLKRVGESADLILYNSRHTKTRAETYLQGWGPVPAGIVAHLGVPVPVPSDLPAGIDQIKPWFMALGTIEPRKGHGLLLDVWEDLAADMGEQVPHLLICGARGWSNAAVFDRLDALPPQSPVREFNTLADGQIAALLVGSRGLLFPSRAEGFGLPPVEAAALGIPVVCPEIAGIREVLRDIPVYAPETDRYQWRNIVKDLIKRQKTTEPVTSGVKFTPPTWDDHFNTVLRFT